MSFRGTFFTKLPTCVTYLGKKHKKSSHFFNFPVMYIHAAETLSSLFAPFSRLKHRPKLIFLEKTSTASSATKSLSYSLKKVVCFAHSI